MKIGIMGFDFNNPNKGCEALSYSFINLLLELFRCEMEIHVFSYADLGEFPRKYLSIRFVWHRLKMKNPVYWLKLKKSFDQCDCVFDITYGDGFSDIYGKVWNANTDMAKQIANMSETPFVLLPQTYGPYENWALKKWAVHLVKNATYAFSRDEQSADEMKALGCSNVVTVTDLAFALPFNKDLYPIKNDKLKIGINVSSLLWDGGHNIKLRIDYKDFCRKFLSNLSSKENVEIHLIPHVIDLDNENSLENDSRVCKLLHDEFSHTVLAPDFENPIEAKSYISNMDVFIGSRMHATIGAVSAGVATIPLAYSKKFKSLFEVLDYPYVIEARELTTNEALETAFKWIDSRIELQQKAQMVHQKTELKLKELKSIIKELLLKRGCYNEFE